MVNTVELALPSSHVGIETTLLTLLTLHWNLTHLGIRHRFRPRRGPDADREAARGQLKNLIGVQSPPQRSRDSSFDHFFFGARLRGPLRRHFQVEH